MDQYSDLVALGLVADVMPLINLNRWYVSKGLTSIQTNPRPIIQELCISSKVNHATITTRDIGFGIGPRLNAAGRLGDPTPVVNALLEHDASKAGECAQTLDKQIINADQLVSIQKC